MNLRRGQLGFILLPIITLLLIGVALGSYALSGKTFNLESNKISDVIGTLEFTEKYILSEAKIVVRMGLFYGGGIHGLQRASLEEDRDYPWKGNFFAKIRERDFNFEKKDTGYVFEVKDLFVEVEVGGSSAKKEFDICMEFDSAGNYEKDCNIK